MSAKQIAPVTAGFEPPWLHVKPLAIDLKTILPAPAKWSAWVQAASAQLTTTTSPVVNVMETSTD